MPSIRISAAEAMKLLGDEERKNKFNVGLGKSAKEARTYKDIVYDSQAEARYAASLDIRVKVGELKQWWRQVAYPLVVNGEKVGKLTVDFKLLYAGNHIELVEIKGVATEAYALRVKLFRALYPREKLTVIKAKEVR